MAASDPRPDVPGLAAQTAVARAGAEDPAKLTKGAAALSWPHPPLEAAGHTTGTPAVVGPITGEPSAERAAAVPRRRRRPSKPVAERRDVRTTIYTTEVEDAVLRRRAAAADLALSDYLRTSGLQAQVVARGDWQRIAQRLASVETRLERLALDLEAEAPALDAMRLASALLALERAVRDLAMPWQRQIAGALDGIGLDAFWPPEAGETNMVRHADDERRDDDALDDAERLCGDLPC